MAWTSPRTWVAGEIVTAANLNTHLRDNLSELRTGGLALSSQAANDFLYASSASQLARLAAAAGAPYYTGSAWAITRIAVANVSVSGAATLNSGINVASVTYNSTGNVTVTFTTAFASANYAAVATCRVNNNRRDARVYSQAVGSLIVSTVDSSAPAAQDTDFNVVVIGG